MVGLDGSLLELANGCGLLELLIAATDVADGIHAESNDYCN
jgi:hypothetical protein